ncbi:MAG: TIGR03750 family conjugal transfer protein [Gammaproteobacteria bacterium]|nr:TIGR03750 family conjugal transfer protein [Gammaproteobacteria bacterium]
MKEPDTLAEHLNEQPPIFRGMSSQELVTLAWVAAIFWLPASLLVCGLFGFIMVGFSVAAIGIGLTVFIVATLFQKIKRGRPDGYYQHLLACICEDLHLKRSPFIRRSGVWFLGRML